MAAIAAFFLFAGCSEDKTLYIVSTGDVHGAWFNQPYVDGGSTKTSLMSVMHYVDSLRSAVGRKNVLLIDAGDILQGDNASYYFNYLKTDVPHLYPRIAHYMGYDAVTVGNHDMETGHPVYDRVKAELEAYGIPFLAGNYLKEDGSSYFPEYAVFRKAGKKVLVLGFGNANIKAWLSENLWSGMEFESLLPYAQKVVDKAVAAEKPDVVVMSIHSGTGSGDESVLESQGMDLFNSLKGVDVLITAHDHRPVVKKEGEFVLMNSGSKAGYVAVATVCDKDGRHVDAKTVRLDKNVVDEAMVKEFEPEFQEVKEFTNKEVGTIAMAMRTRDAYKGMCDYVNLVHTVQISVPEAELSFAAPLTFDGTIKEGTVLFDDMFTIYPYENQMCVVKLTGSEILNYMEYSYNKWIQTPGRHVLRIESRPDPRTATASWSFISRSYNFDSVAGLVYTVDVTKPFGQRISIKSLANGKSFNKDDYYNVSMTSYRANGGGELLSLGAGVADAEAEGRIVAKYPEIRNLIYDYIQKEKTITPELISDPSVIGSWKFVPESLVQPMLEADMRLVFPR